MTIYILHRHNYWTEYLDFLLEDHKTFQAVASQFAVEKKYRNQSLPLFDPEKHHNIITPGIVDDKTKNNTILFRSMHSPGFYILAHLIAYQGFIQYHPDCDLKMLLLDSHYRALITREIAHPKIDEIRYQLMQDPRVRTSSVNLDLYRFLAEPVLSRVKGTGLICMSWLFMYVEMEKIIEIVSLLQKQISLTLVIHPCTSSKVFIDHLFSLEGSLLKKVYFNIPRNQMIELYDQHEFIITDGSGSCYEAMLRGCQPLAIKDLYKTHQYDMAMQLYYDELEEEYFPFQLYTEIKSYREFDNQAFLKKQFPFLYELSYEKAKQIVRQEALEAFE